MKTAAVFALLSLLATAALAEPPAQADPAPQSQKEKYIAQLQKTVIPDFNIHDASIQDAIALLLKSAKEADPQSDPAPFKIDLQPSSGNHVSLQLKNLPELNLLEYLTQLAGVRFIITENGVVIFDRVLVTREYFVPQEFLGAAVKSDAQCRDAIAAMGVGFLNDATTASYDPVKQILTVFNTLPNQRKLSDIAWQSLRAPREKILTQLEKTVIAEADFNHASLAEAIDIVAKKAMEAAPDSRPVPLTIVPGLAKSATRIDLHAKQIPESVLVDYLDGLFKIHSRISKSGVEFGAEDPPAPMLTWGYSFPGQSPLARAGDDAACKQMLSSQGIDFPEGAYARMTDQGILTMRNTEKNLRLFDQIVAGSFFSPAPSNNPPLPASATP